MHAFRCYIFAARIAGDSGPTCINCKRNTAASESRPDTEEVYDVGSIAESESSTTDQ